ncbi:MAG: DUF996 domain-containing protein [Candidatus Bathyarchaeota archaeon]|nr:DUF996 domain-containing protein [Candidatus Bathyarchaeota archaeon]
MSNLESNKTMAMIGSILLIIGGIPFVPYLGVLSLVGVILLLMAFKGFSQSYQDPAMYSNALRGFIYYIIAAIVLAVSVALLWASIASFATIFLIGLGLIGIVGFFVALVVAFIFYVMAAKRLRTSLNALSQKTGEKSFETAGTLLYWGAILTIILIGGILIFIAWIFATIGFFSMKTTGQQQQYSQQPYGYTPPPPPPPPTEQPASAARFCSNCGASIQSGVTFCPSCGKQQSP